MEEPRKESFVKMGWPISSRGNHSAEGKDLVKRLTLDSIRKLEVWEKH